MCYPPLIVPVSYQKCPIFQNVQLKVYIEAVNNILGHPIYVVVPEITFGATTMSQSFLPESKSSYSMIHI